MRHDNDETKNMNGDRMHELLCKVVFGEADAAEQREVEAALADSEELRSLKEELEATATLVRTTMGAEAAPEPTLSSERMESVLAAAGAAQVGDSAPSTGNVITRTPWYRRPVFSAAAAVVLLAGGYAWIQRGDADDIDVAARDEATRITEDQLARDQSAILGFASDSDVSSSTLTDAEIASFGAQFRYLTDQAAQGSTEAIQELDALKAQVSNWNASTAGLTGQIEGAIAQAESIEFRGLGDSTLVDVTNGLEDMATFGLNAGDSGVVGTNASGAPSTGFFFDDGTGSADALRLANEAGKAPSGFDVFTTGSATKEATRANVGVHVMTQPPVGAVGPAAAAPNGPSSPGPPTTPGTPVDRYAAGPSGQPGAAGAAAPTPQRSYGYTAGELSDEAFLGLGEAKKKVRHRASSHGGTYRGPGDSVPPGGSPPAAGGAAPVPRSARPDSTTALNAIGYAGGAPATKPGQQALYYELGRYEAGRAINVSPYGSGGGFARSAFTHDDRRCLRHNPVALPNETPRDMFFRFWGDNPFVVADRDKLSTFAADVDTASFALAKRMLKDGHRPQRAQIRTEEFVNFLEPDLAAPAEGTFALHAELSPSPFGGREDRYLLRVGVRAMEIAEEDRPPLALTFVVDTSGSMKENNRLELVKHAMRLLVDKLDARDTIAIARFSDDATIVLPATPATARDVIETALFGLQPDGSTNAEAGLKLGYELADLSMREGAQSRVVFLSDGVANVGETDQNRIAADVSASSERGVFLNTIGVGMSNHNDVFLEQMADKGQGVCDYVGSAEDARRAIVERFVGGFVTVAKDVKIQVEFDPAVVLRYRQLGYENRAVADKDFRNDAVDAGEIGAGHQVTCLYEVELSGADARREKPIATARIRWKPVTPGEAMPATEATEKEAAFRYDEVAAASFRAASDGFRRAALAAQFAEALRDSIHTAGDSVEELGKELAQLLSDDRHADTATVAEMCRQAIALGLKGRPAPVTGDDEQKHRDAYYDELIRSLGGKPGGDIETATAEERDQESRIRSLIEGNQDRKAH